jgi:tetratricopeptide (TPR) repeat protein
MSLIFWKQQWFTSLCGLWLAAILLGLALPSSAFPFRTLEVGKKVPEIKLKDVDGKDFILSSIQGKKVVLLFWDMNTQGKEKRSVALIGRLEKIYGQFKGEGLEFVSIISDPDAREKINVLKQKFSWSHHILLDEQREIYGAYGIFIIPTVGILDEEKRLLKALPFSHALGDDAEGEILVAMGKKTADELERERHPQETLLPENKRKAQLHFNLGRNLFEKGSRERAKEELSKAVQLDPDHGETYILLGMVHLKEKNPQEAMQFLQKGIDLTPLSRQGRVGMALSLELMGENLKAIEKLEELLKTQKDMPEINYYLGRLYEKEGQKERALEEYKRALQSVFKGK